MPSFGQFELLEPICIAPVETWLAREGNSERPLLLHKFSIESGMRERLLTMKPTDLIMLLRAGEENGACFVVTYDTPELRDFARWVDARTSVPAKPAPVPDNQPGEFTRMFSILPKLAESLPEPGEFTRMFQSPVSSPAPSEPQPPSSVKATNEPGEFTRFFSDPLTSSTLPERLPDAPAEKPEAELAHEPGEFTRQFGPQSSTPPPSDSRGATAVFSGPEPAQQAPSTAASSTSSPGEYTRIVESPQRPTQTPARPSVPASETAAPKAPTPTPAAPSTTPAPRNYVPLILILSVLALAAFALIFYFLLRR